MSGFVVCRANEILVVSGCFKSEPSIVKDGSTFVLPGLQKVQRLSTSNFNIIVELKNQPTAEKTVSINLKAGAVMKINSKNDEMVQYAVDTFLSKTEDEMKETLKETIEATFGSVIEQMSAEDIMFDKRKFSKLAYDTLSSECVRMGVSVISINVLEVSDDHGYYHNLRIDRIQKARNEQEVLGNHDSFVARFDEKRKELEANKSKTSSPEKKNLHGIELEFSNASKDSGSSKEKETEKRVETTYTFSKTDITGDMYKGYDWSAADHKYV
ncbi:hypothetical protein SNE40_000916 [Patella caerulea]|uniref:Band 7 domain-containing protein n=1 Tax=Patella caerulea TaxID=87958 RepID=A0AAN8KET7_PATCE